jgi:predicted metal-dependent enzyme (double-stranded beta helix superfamily)
VAPQEYYIEPVEPVLRRFVEDFRNVVARVGGTPGVLDELRGPTERLLEDPTWISETYRRPVPGTTATWAVYRSQEPDLCIFTMVVPPGEMTKVHNHLTSGWVGLVQGGQIERMFRRTDDGSRRGHAELELVSQDEVSLGELTPLQYPDQDIHQVVTTSRDASVSLHVLCNDLGTVERQTFEPDAQRVSNFVSGYTNVTGESHIGR